MARELVLIDISNIQGYIIGMGRQRLKLIRGASKLLTGVFNSTESDGVNVISSFGGNLLVSVDGEKRDGFIKTIRGRLREETGGIGYRVAHVPLPEPRKFPDAYECLKQQMALEKARAAPSAFAQGGSHWTQCTICGAVPAGKELGDESLCLRCWLKSDVAQTEDLKVELSSIGEHSRPENYLAFIHLDFDGMGNFFREAANHGLEIFGSISKGFETVFRKALCRTKAAASQSAHCEILLQGGDDASVVMPVQDAVPFLLNFQSQFQQAYASHTPLWPTRPTFSIGLVIAHSHFPMREYFRIAKSLEKSAKQLKDLDSVDFEFISGNLQADPIELRKAVAEHERPYRTAKPYALSDLHKLFETAHKLRKSVSSVKVNDLFRIAWESRYQAELDYLCLLSRAGKEERETLWASIGGTLFSVDSQGRRVTKAVDLVELWSLARETAASSHR